MTIQQFKASFKFNTAQHVTQSNVHLITELRERATNRSLRSINTVLDISEWNDVVRDSHSIISLTPISWNDLVDLSIRGHLDFFARNLPIDDFFPLDSNTDITPFY